MLQTFSENTIQKEEISNDEYLRLFLDAKRIEGCSERTIQYYNVTVVKMLQEIESPRRRRLYSKKPNETNSQNQNETTGKRNYIR